MSEIPGAPPTTLSQGSSTGPSSAGGAQRWQEALRFTGPGLLISVGYMDPGNWATGIEAGSRYGASLLFVVGLTSLAAMLLQSLALRLGIVARMDLARACRRRYGSTANHVLWILAEISIIACDVAEVLGTALALHLLLGVSLTTGVALTAVDTFVVLGLRAWGFRQIEAIILALVLTIGACFLVELVLVHPDWRAAAQGLTPRPDVLRDPQALYLAIGILGATVMPHNLYLHSFLVQSRLSGDSPGELKRALRLSTADTIFSLAIAFLVNAAILILAASAFHDTGHREVAQIQDAYHLLEPIVGTSLAPLLFGVALLAAGQSSTFTGTIAGQVILEGFLDLKIARWQRRLITRGLALLPALGGVIWLGDQGVGTLLVASQVALSLQLPFAIWPLLRLTGDRTLMGSFANGPWLAGAGWSIFTVVAVANLWLLLG